MDTLRFLQKRILAISYFHFLHGTDIDMNEQAHLGDTHQTKIHRHSKKKY